MSIDLVSFVNDHMSVLRDWTGKNTFSLLYNSDIDGTYNGILVEKIQNHPNLLFLLEDEENKVFGGFTYKPMIVDNCNQDDKCFLFTFNKDGGNEAMKYKNASSLGLFVCNPSVCLYDLHDDEDGSCLYLSYYFQSGLYVCKPHCNESCCYSDGFDGMNECSLNGKKKFYVKKALIYCCN